MGQPVITLHRLEGLALIIECPSGVLYTNQAGGLQCDQPAAEGALLPLGPGSRIEHHLADFFLRRMTWNSLSVADADAIDRILHTPEKPDRVPPTFFLEVDRARLGQSIEAWVHVTIATSPDEHLSAWTSDGHGTLSNITTDSGRAWHPADQPELGANLREYPFSGLARRRAILTWPNSD